MHRLVSQHFDEASQQQVVYFKANFTTEKFLYAMPLKKLVHEKGLLNEFHKSDQASIKGFYEFYFVKDKMCQDKPHRF
jgi:hypothetical protein